jgi:hypothetical protein
MPANRGREGALFCGDFLLGKQKKGDYPELDSNTNEPVGCARQASKTLPLGDEKGGSQ